VLADLDRQRRQLRHLTASRRTSRFAILLAEGMAATAALRPVVDDLGHALGRAHAGDDAEVRVVAPASKISWLDRLTNAEDDARADPTERAEAASEELPGEQVEAQVRRRRSAASNRRRTAHVSG